MTELEPGANPNSLAVHLYKGLSEPKQADIIPDEIVLSGKPAAVSLLAEGYFTIAAIRARDREAVLATFKDPIFDMWAKPKNGDKARAVQLGQLITGSQLFRRRAF